MSENPFSTVADEAAPVTVEEEAGSRKNVVLLGALAAVALGAGAFLFLGGGEDELDSFAPVNRAPRAAAPVASPVPSAKLPVATNVALGRNPFRALYVQPAAAPAAAPVAPGGAAVPGGTVVLPGFPLTGPGPVSGGGGADAPARPAAGGDAAPPAGPTTKEHELVLVRVFGEGKDQSAVFRIDGKQQTAKIGSTFGPTAEILLLSLQQGPEDAQWTAVLQVGDSDPFDVVMGEPAYVR